MSETEATIPGTNTDPATTPAPSAPTLGPEIDANQPIVTNGPQIVGPLCPCDHSQIAAGKTCMNCGAPGTKGPELAPDAPGPFKPDTFVPSPLGDIVLADSLARGLAADLRALQVLACHSVRLDAIRLGSVALCPGVLGAHYEIELSDARVIYDLSECLARAALPHEFSADPDLVKLAAKTRSPAADVARAKAADWADMHKGLPSEEIAPHGDEIYAWLAVPCAEGVALFVSWGDDAVGLAHRVFVLNRFAAKALSTKLLRAAHDSVAAAQGGAAPGEVVREAPTVDAPPFESAIGTAARLSAAESDAAAEPPPPLPHDEDEEPPC